MAMFIPAKEFNFDRGTLPARTIREGYLEFFNAIADTDSAATQVAKVIHATDIIEYARMPLSDEVVSCAENYRIYWQKQQESLSKPALHGWRDITARLRSIGHDDEIAKSILEPVIQSYVFSGLAVEGGAVLRAAKAFGKNKDWVMDCTDLRNWRFENITSGSTALRSKKTLKLLSQSAVASYDISWGDI
jgi:hypothetical protein